MLNPIVITNKLTPAQLREAESLIQQCCQTDGTRNISFLEGDMNFIDGFPAFFLMYEKNVLISMVSIFVPNADECEFYASTLPEYRRNGCFLKLYKRAYKTAKAFGIKKIYFLIEPASPAAKYVLKKIGARLESCEYLMSCDISFCGKPQGILTLTDSIRKNKRELETFKEGVKAGSVSVELGNGVASIYHVEVEPELRGMGYGTETMLLALEYLRKSGCKRAVLHVSGSNEVAYGMYCRHGFVVEEQIDYWVKELNVSVT